MKKIIYIILGAIVTYNISFAQNNDNVIYSPENIPVCYNFGCNVKEFVSLSKPEWQSVSKIFQPKPNSARVERIRVAKAIAHLEHLIGQYTPTHRDIGYNLGERAVFPGQLDCIDESINTTTYLHLLQSAGLLTFHRVIQRAYRRALFDQHWTGQVQEISTGENYVFDTWFKDNGQLPVVQPTKEWLDISLLTSYTNNSNPKKGTNLVEKILTLFN